MKRQRIDRDVADDVLLGWLLVWGLVLTVAMASTLAGTPARDLPDAAQVVVGLVMGGLAAVLISAGTWAALIHLPRQEQIETNTRRDQSPALSSPDPQQRIAPRVSVILLIGIHFAVLTFSIRQNLGLAAQLLVIVSIGVTGPLLVWQYTRKRIYRRAVSIRGRQSIRQILGMVFTIAIASAGLKLADRGFGLSTSTVLFILSVAGLWTMMLLIMLGRWWWLIFLTTPLFALQWFVIASMIDARTAEGGAEFLRLGGLIVAFYLFGLLFLSLMRSSGHRWLGHSPVETLPVETLPAETDRPQMVSRNSGFIPKPQ